MSPSSDVHPSTAGRPGPGRARPALARVLAAVVGAGCAMTLAACGSSTGSAGTDRGAAAPVTSTTSTSADPQALSLGSGWVKAGSGMTAAFGTIRNTGTRPITIVKGSSDQAGTVQLHTMEKQPDGSMKMMEKAGGFVVPAGGSLTLAPGGNHIMLMDLPAALANGQQVGLQMVADDGTKFVWSVPVRSFAGADETYKPDMPSTTGSMSGMTPTAPAPSSS